MIFFLSFSINCFKLNLAITNIVLKVSSGEKIELN